MITPAAGWQPLQSPVMRSAWLWGTSTGAVGASIAWHAHVAGDAPAECVAGISVAWHAQLVGAAGV